MHRSQLGFSSLQRTLSNAHWLQVGSPELLLIQLLPVVTDSQNGISELAYSPYAKKTIFSLSQPASDFFQTALMS